MLYRKFAKLHGWAPETVRKLRLDELYWLPVIEEAEAEASERYQAVLDKQQ